MYDLNALVPPGSGLQLAEALAINDDGVIDGNALPPGCHDIHACAHAFLLIPCGDDDHGACRNELLSPAVSNGYVLPTGAGSAMTSPGAELPAGRLNRLRNRMRRPHQIPGQSAEFPD